jgi:isopenicillin N synthase-like dioxygenase
MWRARPGADEQVISQQTPRSDAMSAGITRAMIDDAESDGFPVLDVGGYIAGDPHARETLAAELAHALERVGFLVVVNHGVPQPMIDAIFAAAARFHAMPLPQKMALRMQPGAGIGYLPSASFAIKTSEINDNRQPDLNEAFFVDRERSPDDPEVRAGKPFREINRWPTELTGFRDTALAYYAALEAFALRLLPIFATALALPPDWFDRAFVNPQCTLRLSHYPPARYADNQFGIAPHTDTSFLTILPQSAQEGLYIRPAGRRWMKAPRIPGSLVINSGDMCRRWTNDRFLSTQHFAINPTPDRPRYAAPFFFAPNTDFTIRCLETCCGPDNPPRYPDVTYEQYRMWFLRNNYQTAADAPAELAKP